MYIKLRKVFVHTSLNHPVVLYPKSGKNFGAQEIKNMLNGNDKTIKKFFRYVLLSEFKRIIGFDSV